MAELRTYCHLDILQPQYAAFVATTGKGYLPVERQAALFGLGMVGAQGMHALRRYANAPNPVIRQAAMVGQTKLFAERVLPEFR